MHVQEGRGRLEEEECRAVVLQEGVVREEEDLKTQDAVHDEADAEPPDVVGRDQGVPQKVATRGRVHVPGIAGEPVQLVLSRVVVIGPDVPDEVQDDDRL